MKNYLLSNQRSKDFSSGNYYPALDGLRGFAILLVVLYHNFSFLPFSEFGWIGLDLFFVLSGFLITGILLKKRNSNQFLRNFYARRILRIFPIYYLSILIFLFILPDLIAYPFGIRYFIENQYWFWLEIQNWLFIIRPQGNNHFLDHFWSLALEEQFYLLSPWVILLIKPLQKIIGFVIFLLMLVFFLRIMVWLQQVENISYIDLYKFTRIDGLCIGSLLAIFIHQGNFEINKINKWLSFVFLTLVFVSIPLLKILCQIRLPYLACCLYPGIAFFWGWIVWRSIDPGSIINRIFKIRVFVFFGKISYGLYVFHWPIYRLARIFEVSISQEGISFPVNLLTSVIFTALAVALATLSYYTYEKYFIRLKKYFI